MKLNKLVINNFLSIQHAELELADKGLISIEGINKDATGSDSNGCGKSSLINALLWCLYGSYGKDGSADDIVNSKEGKDCFVESVWGEDDRVYSIIRYRKHGKFRNSIKVILDGKDITKAGAQAVQEQINEIIGANESIFRASCFDEQENPPNIPAMSDKQLKELLETVLPFEDLSGCHAKAIKNRQSKRASVEDIERKLYEEKLMADHNKRSLQESLASRLKYTEEADAKNAKVEANIKAKRLAYGVALSMSNTGSLEKELKEVRWRLDCLGESNVPLALSDCNVINSKVEGLEKELATPENRCKSCGQEVEDLEVYLARKKAELAGALKLQSQKKKTLQEVRLNSELRTALERRLTELKDKLAEAKRSADAAERLKAEIRLLEGHKATTGENPHQAAVTRYRDALKANIATQKTLEEQLNSAKAELEIAEAAEHTYSPKGIRYHMLEEVAPTLTAYTNKYLSTLTDGAITATWSTVTRLASGEYREKFSIEASMEGRNKFALLSGGEKRKVRLACFYALQDLIAMQASKQIELWIGDEIDHALDSAGLERLMVLLHEKLKQKKTILVISHNDLKAWIPQSIRVIREDGISTVTQD